jgi:hypothetical protein
MVGNELVNAKQPRDRQEDRETPEGKPLQKGNDGFWPPFGNGRRQGESDNHYRKKDKPLISD